MARTTGPLLSLSASGSVAGTMTYASWKGRSYVRQTVTPANPKSKAQTAQRAMMRFLSQQWANLDPSAQANWQELATQDAVSPFNAYVKYNLMQWTQAAFPTEFPTSSSGTAGTIGTSTYTGGTRQISISQVLTTEADAWGVMYYVDLSANPATNKQNAVLAINLHGVGDGDTAYGTITDLKPGSYYVGRKDWALNGNAGATVEDATPIVVT